MMRSLLIVVCVICVATVLTQALGLSYLWMNGQLDSDSVSKIQLVLAGGPSAGAAADAEDQGAVPASNDDVMKERVGRVWDLYRRQEEMALIKNTVTNSAAKGTALHKKFQDQKNTFLKELQAISDNLNSTSADQARLILKKLPPADATQSLMSLTLDQNVLLLKGMEAKTIATLLEQFQQSNDKKQNDRGQEIFTAISNGEPTRKIVNNGNNRFQAAPKTPPKQLPKQPKLP